MTIKEYIQSALMLTLLWTSDVVIGEIAKVLAKYELGDYLGSIRGILSTITTFIIFLTAWLKYRREKKQIGK